MGWNRFRKVLCLSLNRRADFTRALLSSVSQCSGIENYLLLANVEEESEETLGLALGVNFAETNIAMKPRAGNFSERAFTAIDRGFAKAEFVAYVDGDTAVTQDFLRYLEQGAETFRDDPDIFLLSGFGENHEDGDVTRHSETARRAVKFGSAAGIWRNRWEWSKRSARAKAPDYLNQFGKLAARYKLQEAYPVVSRCGRLDKTPAFTCEPRVERFRQAKPSVTAVMITGLKRERYPMARISIECFKSQTYPNKNLLIVNHGEESLCSNDSRIRELRLQKSRWQTVGDLRNLALEHATGDFIINWDDDDWHHPRRMEVQMKAQMETRMKDGQEDAAVLLKNRIHHSLVNGCSRYAEYPKGAEATILHPRRMTYRYPSLLRGSDSVFVRQFTSRLAIENDPAMHIRFFHGMNLWDAGHIMGHLGDAGIQGVSELSDEHRALLTQVLPLYGKRLPE